MDSKPKPSDKLAYFIIIYLGVCTLISWNVILSIMDFFNEFVGLINLIYNLFDSKKIIVQNLFTQCSILF